MRTWNNGKASNCHKEMTEGGEGLRDPPEENPL